MKRVTNRLGLFVLAWLIGGGASALTTDGDQPINIEADWAEADKGRRTTVYKGNVVITQGSMRITGDTVTMYFDEANELKKMVAIGRPARFRQRPDGQDEYQQSRAKRMEYYAQKDLIFLLGDAHSWQGDDRISADRIVWDTLSSRVKAETDQALKTGQTQNSRVKITIVPDRKCEEAAEKSPECRK